MAHLNAPEYGATPRCLLCLGHGQSADFSYGLPQSNRKLRAIAIVRINDIIGIDAIVSLKCTLAANLLLGSKSSQSG